MIPGLASLNTSRMALQGAAEPDEFERTFRELQAWADTTEDKHALLHAKFQARQGRHAFAIKYGDLPMPICFICRADHADLHELAPYVTT